MLAPLSKSTTHDELCAFLLSDSLYAKYASDVAARTHLDGRLLFSCAEQGPSDLHKVLTDADEGFGFSSIAASAFASLIQTSSAAAASSIAPAPDMTKSMPMPGKMVRQKTRKQSLIQQASMLAQRKASMGKASNMGESTNREVVIINRSTKSLTQLMPKILALQPLAVIAGGLIAYALLIVLFALLFYACGADCFIFSSPRNQFDFEQMLWLSVHTISSVGYGSISPICATGQLIVFLETYAMLLIQGLFGGYIVFAFMRSRAKVRFSKNCVVSAAEDGRDSDGSSHYPAITFRMVRETATQLRDAHIYVQARFSLPDPAAELADLATPFAAHEPEDPLRPRSPETGFSGFPRSRHRSQEVTPVTREFVRSVELSLVTDHLASLDFWTVVHRIDEASPLWPVRYVLQRRLKSIDVSISAYDPAFGQPVKLFARYAQHELVHNAHFESMETIDEQGLVTTIDYSKIDLWKESQQQRKKPGTQ